MIKLIMINCFDYISKYILFNNKILFSRFLNFNSIVQILNMKMNLVDIKQTHFNLFYNSIKIFLVLGRCFNIIPYTIELPETKTSAMKKTKKISYILIIQFIVTTCINCAVIISTHYQHIEFDTTMGFLTRLLYMGEYFFGIFNMILIMYGCLYQRKNYTKFLLKLNEIDLKLVRFNAKIDFKFINLYFKFYLIIYGVFFLIVLIIDFLYNRLYMKSFLRSSTVYTLCITQCRILLAY